MLTNAWAMALKWIKETSKSGFSSGILHAHSVEIMKNKLAKQLDAQKKKITDICLVYRESLTEDYV